MSLETPDDFDPTPFDPEEPPEDADGEDVTRDADGENADLCIDPEVIAGFSDWKDPTSPPPWEQEGSG